MTTPSAFQGDVPRAQGARSRLPRLRDVLREQLRAIGRALRTPMLIAAAFAVAATIVLAIQVASGNMTGHGLVQPSALPGVVGALLPVAVWAREERFGPGFLWTLPVDRSRHALVKVLAGWLWLMAGVALYALCQLVLALVSDGRVLPVETLRVLTAPLPTSGPLDPATLRTVEWAPGPTIWAVPFVAATASYLLASAVMLGIRHPLRWFAGAVLAVPVATVATGALGHVLGVARLADVPARAASRLVNGRYGLEALLTLRTWSLDRRATLTTGELIEVWKAVPDLTDWGTAALLWTGAGLLALLAAAARHRERRRA